ncbi:MAG: endonuclease/exonuclease/phosphatase family protein [Planctomycetaceae bacterium]|nr:endonuclease/exonuclease/phosphatase family protein [Planctomycetaceae bacterium]
MFQFQAFFLMALALVASMTSRDAVADEANETRVMSFNIRFGTASDGDNHWSKRDTNVVRTIQAFDPDLLGTQETLGFQAEFLQKHLPDLTYVGASRDENPNGEQCGIMYRANRYELRKDGQFWLSETPDTRFSRSWDSSLPRIATWVQLRDRTTGQELLFLNTHFDHKGRQARLEAARLIREFIDQQPAELPVIVTGDFNCAVDSEPYQELTSSPRLSDSFLRKNSSSLPNVGTFNGFQGTTSGSRIDWILTSKDWSVTAAEIVRTSYDGLFPSDHFPVTATLRLPAAQ